LRATRSAKYPQNQAAGRVIARFWIHLSGTNENKKASVKNRGFFVFGLNAGMDMGRLIH
jgi:hypothetical protein